MNKRVVKLNQQGIAPFALLFIIVLGVFIMWEFNESITYFPRMDAEKLASSPVPSPADTEPVCLTGISDDCNDSNDVFILPE